MKTQNHLNFKTVWNNSFLLLGILIFNLNSYSQPPGVFGSLYAGGNTTLSGMNILFSHPEATITFNGTPTFNSMSTFNKRISVNEGLLVKGGVAASNSSSYPSSDFQFVSAADYGSTPNLPFFKITKQYYVGSAPILPLLTATHKGIGIGTASPLYPLHVVGESLFEGVTYMHSRVHLNNSATLSVTTGYAIPQGGIKILTDGGVLVRNSSVDIFKVNVIDKTTYVNKLKVTLTNPFPDYVFDKDYKLLSIKEVEEYISKNHHLPNIKSAAEYKKEDGVDIGELQLKLMEKIEELTLYIIQQQKEIELLKQKNSN